MRDSFRVFKVLEPYFCDPRVLAVQSLIPLTPDVQSAMLDA